MRAEEISVNGVRINDAAATPDSEVAPRVITLPSGRSAAVRRGLGRDLMRAQRAAGGSGEPSAIVFALIAELVVIEGENILYEDVLAMDLADVLALQAEVAGENFQFPPPPPSPPSSTSGSR